MKTAIIGLGNIGRVHYSVLNMLEKNIVAVCDIDASKFKDYPSIAQYTNYIEMLNEVKPDIVHICTPHHLHTEMIISALERDINVICEKPMCIKKEDIALIEEAEKKSKAILGISHQNRYNSAICYVKKRLEDQTILGGYGTVVWNRDEKYYAQAAWRGKWATEGGGVMINQALHTLDILQWLIGEPKFVIAQTPNFKRQNCIEVEDSNIAIFSGGAEFSFYATNGSATDFPAFISVRTQVETISILNDTVLINGKPIEFAEDTTIYGKACYGSGHKKLISDFYECVKQKRHFPIDAKEAGKVVKLILACYNSQGKNIEI